MLVRTSLIVSGPPEIKGTSNVSRATAGALAAFDRWASRKARTQAEAARLTGASHSYTELVAQLSPDVREYVRRGEVKLTDIVNHRPHRDRDCPDLAELIVAATQEEILQILNEVTTLVGK